jgi:hypothetical protein
LAATDTSTKKKSRQRKDCGLFSFLMGAIDFVKVSAKNIFSTAASAVQGRRASNEIITKVKTSITLMQMAVRVS